MKFSSWSIQSSGFLVLLNVSSVVVSKYVERSVDVLEYIVGEPVTLLDSSDCDVNEVVSVVQVNLCQNLLFLHQLTHNMTKDCSLIYQFLHENYKLRTCCVHKLFGMSKQKRKNNL